METYIIDSNTERRFRELLFQQDGSGPDIDRYIFNAQDGSGIGSFFGKIFSMALPIVKNVGRKIIVPAAKRAGQEAIKGSAEYALSKLSDSVTRKRTKKRKVSSKHKKKRRYV